MAFLQLSNYVNDIYKMLGNLTRDQLPIEMVMVYLNNELSKRAEQLSLSEHNYFLKFAERSITDVQDQPISVDDFGTMVEVTAVNPATFVPMPIEMVHFNTLNHYLSDGRLVCAIYGQGNAARIRFSVQLNQFAGWKLKYWYEPSTETPKQLTGDSPVLPKFRPLVTNATALMLMPFVPLPEEQKASIEARLVNALGSPDIDGSWEALWWKEINASRQYGNNKRRAFRAGKFSRNTLRY